MKRTTSRMRVVQVVILIFLLLLSGILLSIGGRVAVAAPGQTSSSIGGCPVFPTNNVWNRDISTLPVHSNSANYIASIGPSAYMHADFGSGLYDGGPIGIPYVAVPGNQPPVPVTFSYPDESDPGSYPIPPQAPIEGGPQSNGDRHVLVLNSATCKLYETFSAYPQANGSWKAGSGAIWDLNSNALRPQSWTSADAAGLSILPGLARYDEVAAGVITHALRVTMTHTQKAYIWPARHFASSNTDPNLPPMGLRLRLKASVNIAAFPPQCRVVLTALRHYGMIVADNGTSLFLSGAPDPRWNNDDLFQLKNIHNSDFEAIDESSLEVNANSAQALTAVPPTPTPTKATATATPTKAAIHVTVIAHVAVPEQEKKKVLVQRSTVDMSGMGLLLPLAGSVLVLLLLGGAWLLTHRKRSTRE